MAQSTADPLLSITPSQLTAKGRTILAQYTFVTEHLAKCEGRYQALQMAKNAHIAELKQEIIEGKTGLDLSALLDD